MNKSTDGMGNFPKYPTLDEAITRMKTANINFPGTFSDEHISTVTMLYNEGTAMDEGLAREWLKEFVNETVVPLEREASRAKSLLQLRNATEQDVVDLTTGVIAGKRSVAEIAPAIVKFQQ
jgi:hypothetical protein